MGLLKTVQAALPQLKKDAGAYRFLTGSAGQDVPHIKGSVYARRNGRCTLCWQFGEEMREWAVVYRRRRRGK